MTKINILDCTIRDGSYAVDYQFTLRDVIIIGSALEKAGFQYIEIGHGVGFRGSEKGKGDMVETDERYCKTASDVFNKAYWGMFVIPGIGELKDLDMATRYGMRFCRVGVNIDEIEQAKMYVHHAKKLGMQTCVNLMKSYAVSARDFGKYAKRAYSFGADVVYLVDSAGGMFPEQVREYVRAAKSECSIPIGFHGHNNLSLAVANSLAAVKEGATYIDASLQGLGRSAGNTEMEPLLFVLKEQGYETGVDELKALDIGQRFIKPMIRAGRDEVAIICGSAQFHSSYLPIIERAAAKYDVDKRKLIQEVTKHDKLNAPAALVNRIAEQLSAERTVEDDLFDTSTQRIVASNPAEHLIKEVRAQALKHGKRSVIVLAKAERSRVPPIREDSDVVVGSLDAASESEITNVINSANNRIDLLLLDVGNTKLSVHKKYWEKGIVPYDDDDALVRSLVNFLLQIRAPGEDSVIIKGLGEQSARLALSLCTIGFMVTLHSKNQARAEQIAEGINTLLGDSSRITTALTASGSTAMVVGMGGVDEPVTRDFIQIFQERTVLVDGLPGSLSPEALQWASANGHHPFRFDTRTGLLSIVKDASETRELVTKHVGSLPREGYRIVAGGIIGDLGDVIVDSISNPYRIIGVADGKGQVLESNTEYFNRLEEVERWILNKQPGRQE